MVKINSKTKFNPMKPIIYILTTIAVAVAYTQPNTEIYLFDLDKNANGEYTISSPLNISENEGYDNQPSFWPDGKSIVYARTADNQTEIARYFIGTGKTKLITNTLQGSEYSPTPTPDGRISSIRLDTTGLQLLYSYGLDGTPEVLVDDLVIGYHSWISEEEIITFVLGEPNTLQYINLKSKKIEILAENIGRSLHKIPDSKSFSYLDKSGDDWIIKARNIKKNKAQEVARVKEGSEDYCWTPDKDIIMGQGSMIWSWNYQTGWREVFDLKNYGLEGITRVAISPQGDQLALVVNK